MSGEEARELAGGNGSAPVLQWIDPNWLSVMTVDNTVLDLRVEILDEEPEVPGLEWTDVREVSLLTHGPAGVAAGMELSGGTELPLDPDLTYRVRYSIRHADAQYVARETDAYLLQLWPAALESPIVVRATSEWGSIRTRPI